METLSPKPGLHICMFLAMVMVMKVSDGSVRFEVIALNIEIMISRS